MERRTVKLLKNGSSRRSWRRPSACSACRRCWGGWRAAGCGVEGVAGRRHRVDPAFELQRGDVVDLVAQADRRDLTVQAARHPVAEVRVGGVVVTLDRLPTGVGRVLVEELVGELRVERRDGDVRKRGGGLRAVVVLGRVETCGGCCGTRSAIRPSDRCRPGARPRSSRYRLERHPKRPGSSVDWSAGASSIAGRGLASPGACRRGTCRRCGGPRWA